MKVNDEPVYECLSCFDNWDGWRESWCPGKGKAFKGWHPPERSQRALVLLCDRRFEHAPHQQAARCECWGHNSVVNARRAHHVQRRAAQQEAASQRRRA